MHLSPPDVKYAPPLANATLHFTTGQVNTAVPSTTFPHPATSHAAVPRRPHARYLQHSACATCQIIDNRILPLPLQIITIHHRSTMNTTVHVHLLWRKDWFLSLSSLFSVAAARTAAAKAATNTNIVTTCPLPRLFQQRHAHLPKIQLITQPVMEVPMRSLILVVAVAVLQLLRA